MSETATPPDAGAPAAGTPPPTGAAPDAGAPPAAGSPPAIDWAPLYAEPGKLKPDWHAALPEEARKVVLDNMTAARAKTEGMLKLPGEAATDDERNAFTAALHKHLGVPEAPDGYGIKAPESLPDGVSWDDGMAGEFAKVAHSIGLTPAQVAKLQEFQVGYIGQQVTGAREQAAQALQFEQAELKKHFGADIDKAVGRVQGALKADGFDPSIADPQSPNFWGPDFLRYADLQAKRSGEDRLAGGTPVQHARGAAAAKDIMTNPENPLYAKYQAHDATVVAQVKQLMQQGG